MSDKDQETRYERKLKKLSVKQIEEAMANAISSLVGKEYEIDIMSVDFLSDKMGFMDDKHEIRMIIKQKAIKFNWDDIGDNKPL